MGDSVEVKLVPVDGGHVWQLTMDRPGARNAMDTTLLAGLLEALDQAESSADARGVLLTGASGMFSAGADIRERIADGGRRRRELFTAVYERLTLLRLPTAAAVEGFAIGGGAEAAAACDLRVAGRGAVFRFAGAIYGVPVGVARTVGQVGLSTAKDWVLSSRDVGAEEAARAGFVQRLVDDGETRRAALQWLETVASRDQTTVAVLKRLFNEQSGLRDRTAYENDGLRVQAESGMLPEVSPPTTGPGGATIRPRRR